MTNKGKRISTTEHKKRIGNIILLLAAVPIHQPVPACYGSERSVHSNHYSAYGRGVKEPAKD